MSTPRFSACARQFSPNGESVQCSEWALFTRTAFFTCFLFWRSMRTVINCYGGYRPLLVDKDLSRMIIGCTSKSATAHVTWTLLSERQCYGTRMSARVVQVSLHLSIETLSAVTLALVAKCVISTVFLFHEPESIQALSSRHQ